MRALSILLLLLLTALPAISQTSEVCIPIQSAEILWRDRERCRITIEELLYAEQEVIELRKANYAARKEAAFADSVATNRKRQVDEIGNQLENERAQNQQALIKTKLIAAGGYVLAAIITYLSLAN